VKWLVRGAVAFVAFAALAIGALAWAVPRLAKSEAARAKIEALARAALGRDLHYAEIGAGLFPPSLLVVSPEIAGAAAGDPPLARAERIALRVELWPLFRRQLEVASLAIDGLALHLVRTADGFVLPKPEGAPTPPPPSEPDAGRGGGEGLGFGIRELAVRNAALVLDDRSASPAKTWSVLDADLTAKSKAAGEPIAIEGSLTDIKGGALEVAGPVSIEAKLDRLGAGATGPFQVDAKKARVVYGADFSKPAGTALALSGRIAAGDGGALAIDDLELALSNLVARGALRTAPRTELSLAAEPFALDGWEAIIPPLGLAKPSGRVAIPKLAVSTGPLAARGEIALDDLVATPPDMAPVALRGAIELRGTELRTRELVARAANQPIRIDATVTELFDGPRYEVAFETKGADTNALLSGYAKQRDRLEGPLDLKGTLRGTTSGATSILEALSGDLALDIEKGRIVGVSLLEAVLGSFGPRITEVLRQQGGKDWERFTSDQFESLRARLVIAGGRVQTEPISLTYPDWGAQLEGPIRLADLALDLKGRLTIKESLDAALARAFGTKGNYAPQTRVVDLAKVEGELGAPRVQITGSAVATLAAAYAGAVERDELKKRLEKQLGPGSGEIVDQGLDILQGVLGGKKK
jgi:AsmA protein